MNLDTLISQQNPQWIGSSYQKPEKDWFYRPFFEKALSWLDKRLIIALTGLRRTGKSTILKQIKYFLEEKKDPERVMYFSFEKSQVKLQPDFLKEVINWYLAHFLKTTPAALSKTVYIFLDEIQYIPYWQDTIKTFYDESPKIKFFISGSSSLFIKKKFSESLAGRMIEMAVLPLSFHEFIKIKNILKEKPLPRLFSLQKQIVTSFFEEYLEFGQFPELVKDNYKKEQSQIYLSSIEEKIIEQDLPKLYRIERVDILRLIFDYLKSHPGSIVEYQNLTNDLGIDLKTTRKYFEYLQKSFLIDFCLNQTKKPVRSARTAKKIYLVSTNFAQGDISLLAENYVFNHLVENNRVKFYRRGNFEVDFVVEEAGKLFPIEVKYQEKISPSDYKNLLKLAKLLQADKAFLITKDFLAERLIEGVKTKMIPACLLEEKQLAHSLSAPK